MLLLDVTKNISSFLSRKVDIDIMASGEKKKIVLSNKWKMVIVGIIVIAALIIVTTPRFNSPSYVRERTSVKTTKIETSTPQETQRPHIYALHETFMVSNYALALGDYTFDIINNRFTEKNGQTVIKIPITETNNSDEVGQFNMFSVECYNPSGHEISWAIGSLFDDSKVNAKNIMPGVTQTSYIYIPYDQNGEYTMIFGVGHNDETTVKFNVTR